MEGFEIEDMECFQSKGELFFSKGIKLALRNVSELSDAESGRVCVETTLDGCQVQVQIGWTGRDTKKSELDLQNGIEAHSLKKHRVETNQEGCRFCYEPMEQKCTVTCAICRASFHDWAECLNVHKEACRMP
jgi:hypothetical protein